MFAGATAGPPTRLPRMVVHDYVVGWGTLTLINAGLAQGKGRSGLVWFLLSLLLGPIATLLIVILPNHAARALP
jgi:hypothetical protein